MLGLDRLFSVGQLYAVLESQNLIFCIKPDFINALMLRRRLLVGDCESAGRECFGSRGFLGLLVGFTRSYILVETVDKTVHTNCLWPCL
jgi:hypothetical protein